MYFRKNHCRKTSHVVASHETMRLLTHPSQIRRTVTKNIKYQGLRDHLV
jgi:hypothetical protein